MSNARGSCRCARSGSATPPASSAGRNLATGQAGQVRQVNGQAVSEVSMANQLAVAGSATALPVGLDLPCAEDPELFFAESPQDVEQAKAMCRGCRARIACLTGARERREPWGVWGGELLLGGAIVPRKRPRTSSQDRGGRVAGHRNATGRVAAVMRTSMAARRTGAARPAPHTTHTMEWSACFLLKSSRESELAGASSWRRSCDIRAGCARCAEQSEWSARPNAA